MTLHERVIPNLVGVDIGCGMLTILLKEREIDFDALDRVIREHVPSGFSVRETLHPFADYSLVNMLHCLRHINQERVLHSVGTLDGGNHFIEVDRDDDGRLYLVIHSGSRYLGKQVAAYYQSAAAKALQTRQQTETKGLIDLYKRQGRQSEIQALL